MRSKNPTGISMNPVYSTGITGQSSGRTKWVTPNVYQSTTSVSVNGRSAAVQRGETITTGVLVGELTGGASFVARVRRDPEVVTREAGALADTRLGRGEHRRRGHGGHELVAHRLTEPVVARLVDHPPGAAGRGVHLPLGGELGGERGDPLAERVAPGVVGPGRHHLGLDLVHRVLRSVDVEIEAGGEEVLVVGCRDPGRDDVGELGTVAGRDRHGRHDPRELHLQLDVAVEVEVPVEAVLVVADGGDEAHDQTARAAGLVGAALQVVVLPEDPVVLLVHADRVLDGVRVALLGGEHRVEVVDDTEAVAAQLQRVGHATEAPLAGVEGVLPSVHRAGVAVGDDHLGDRRAVQHRPHAVAVVVRHRVQDEALVRIEADPERPLRPAHVVPVDLEARAVGLHDLERLQVVAQRSDGVGQVVPAVLRHRHHAEVDDLEHRARAGVEEREDALDRLRVPVVGRLGAEVGDAAADAAAILVRRVERSRGPRVDLHLVEVFDAATPHRRLPVGILLDADDGGERLTEQERRAHARVHRPRRDLSRGDRHDRLDRLQAPRRDEQGFDLTIDGRAGFVREHDRLVGLAQPQVREHEVGLVPVVGRDQRDRGTDLVGGDRVERMQLAHCESARCWRMYSAVPDTKPSTLFAFPVT